MLEEKSVIVLMKKKKRELQRDIIKLGMFLVYIIISYSDSFPLK